MLQRLNSESSNATTFSQLCSRDFTPEFRKMGRRWSFSDKFSSRKTVPGRDAEDLWTFNLKCTLSQEKNSKFSSSDCLAPFGRLFSTRIFTRHLAYVTPFRQTKCGNSTFRNPENFQNISWKFEMIDNCQNWNSIGIMFLKMPNKKLIHKMKFIFENLTVTTFPLTVSFSVWK